VHHDLRRMGHFNFNLTFPLCDRLFGTVWKPESEPARLEGRRA
jgi:sterol desaturase/sphingolipid hydroxylase (fatty acid hydroxylase superfamily)